MFKKILQSKIFTVLMVLAAGFLVFSLLRVQQPLGDLRNEAKNIDQKIAEIKKQEETAKKENDYLKSAAFLERELRLKLNYKKLDESVVIVYRNHLTPNVASSSQSIIKEPANWQRWLEYLFGIKI